MKILASLLAFFIIVAAVAQAENVPVVGPQPFTFTAGSQSHTWTCPNGQSTFQLTVPPGLVGTYTVSTAQTTSAASPWPSPPSAYAPGPAFGNTIVNSGSLTVSLGSNYFVNVADTTYVSGSATVTGSCSAAIAIASMPGVYAQGTPPAASPQPGIGWIDQLAISAGLPTPGYATVSGPACCTPWPTGNYVLFNNAANGATFWDEHQAGDWKSSGVVLFRLYINNNGYNTLPISFQQGGSLGAYEQSTMVGTSLSMDDAGEPGWGVPTCPTGGSLASTTYFERYTVVNQNGESLAQPVQSITCPANTVLQQTPPTPGAGAAEWNLYVGASDPGEQLQNATPMPLSATYTMPTAGPTTGPTTPPCDHSGGSYSLHTGNGNTVWAFGIPANTVSPCPATISVGNQSTQTPNVTFNAAAGPTFNGLGSATNNLLCGANATPSNQCPNFAINGSGAIGIDGNSAPTNGLACGVANTTFCTITVAGGSTTTKGAVINYATACSSGGASGLTYSVQNVAELLVKCNGNTVATGTMTATTYTSSGLTTATPGPLCGGNATAIAQCSGNGNGPVPFAIATTTPTGCTAFVQCMTVTENFPTAFTTTPKCPAPSIFDTTTPATIWVGNVEAVSASAVTFNVSPMVTFAASARTLSVTDICELF